MLKKSFLALSFMALSSAAFSAPIANLKIEGIITPPTCTIQGQNEADLIYQFDITPGLFPASGDLLLTAQTKNIQVVCDAITYLAFDTTDNRAGSELDVTKNFYFGLGVYDMDGTETKIGYYHAFIGDATVQNDPEAEVVDIGFITSGDYAKHIRINKVENIAWAISPSSLASGKIFSANLTVVPVINSQMKNSSGGVTLDGHAILAFKFGL